MFTVCADYGVELTELMHSLLDPSCSGSGIVNRLDHLLETGAEFILLISGFPAR